MSVQNLWQFRDNPTYPAVQQTFRQVDSSQVAALLATGDFVVADAFGPPYPPWDALGSLPDPTLASIAPTTEAAATPFTLTCTGTNFTAASKIRISGVEQLTTFVNATTLTCTYTGTAGNKSVLVRTPGQPDTATRQLVIT